MWIEGGIKSLIEPARSVTSPEAQNQARLLAALSLVVIIFYLLLTIVFMGGDDGRWVWALVSIPGTAIIYAISRSPRYRVGIQVLPVALLGTMLLLLINRPEIEVLLVMVVPVLIAGFFWSPIALAWLTLVSLSLGLVVVAPYSDIQNMMRRSLYILALASAQIIAAVLRRQMKRQLQQRTKELTTAETRFRAVIDNGPDGYFLLRSVRDPSGKIVDFEFADANANGIAQLNHTAATLIGTRMLSLPAEWIPRLFGHFKTVVETRTAHVDEIRSFSSDRRESWWYSVMAVAVEDGVAVTSREITEHKRVHDALRESEARFRNIADSAPVLMWVSEPDKRITYFNRAWLEFTGREIEQEVDYGWVTGLHPDDAEDTLKMYETAFDARKPYQMLYRLRRADGEYRWLLENGVPRFSDQGMFLGYLGSALDITAQKAQEAALRESQAWLEAAMKSLPFDFWAMDVRGRYVLQNEHSRELWGNNIGKAPEELGLRPEVLREWKSLNAQAFAGQESRVEMVYQRGGDIRYHYNVVVPVHDGERIIGIAGVDIDITDTKQMEAKLRALLQAIPDFMARINREGVYLEAIHGGDFTDMMFSDQIVGKKIHQVLPREIADQRLSYVHRALDTGELQTYEYVLESPGSQLRNLEARVSVSGPDEVTVMVRDVTARKEAEERAMDLAMQSKHIELLRRFVGDRTHDLMTPLTILKTSLYLVEKSASANRRAEHLAKFSMQIDNLESMIRNMLMILRLDKPIEDEFEFELQDLNALMTRIVADHQPIAISRQQILLYVEQTNLPLLMFDAEKLERALSNLIDNALKYTPPGGTVSISTGLSGDTVRLTVRDNGRGIPSEDLPHIFDRFYRSADSLSVAGGSGLGLAIVDKIIKAHDGHIKAESEPGRGTAFHIYLPVSTMPLPEDPR